MADVQKLTGGTFGDAGSSSAFAVPLITFTNSAPLVANTAVAFVVPAASHIAVFTSTVNIWVKADGTATVPGATITTGVAPMLNPLIRSVTPGTTISIISDIAGHVTVSYYR